MDAMVSSKEKFRIRLEEQTTFEPYGELLSKFVTSMFYLYTEIYR